MDPVHLHLMLNHVPVVGTLFGVLLLSAAALRRNDEWLKVGLALFALSALAAGVVYLTGEPAEEAVEKLAGFSEDLLERHEEAATVSAIALGAFGIVALAELIVLRRRRPPRWLAGVTLVLALIPTALMGWTANLGGQVRHTEIRGGTAVMSTSGERGADDR